MTKEDKDTILQYVKTPFIKVEENLINGELITQMTSFGIESRKIFTIFINNELIEHWLHTMKCVKMKEAGQKKN